MNERILLVVINKTVVEASTKEQVEWATLGDWKIDLRKAPEIDYIIGIKDQVGFSCYHINGFSVSKETKRVRFTFDEDLSQW